VTWTQIPVTGTFANQGAAMVYDPLRKRSILTGCRGNGCTATWEWDGTALERLPDAPVPVPSPAGAWSGLVYDSARKVAVSFGGFIPRGVAPTRYMQCDETWLHDSAAGKRPVQLFAATGFSDPSTPISLKSAGAAFWAGATSGAGDGAHLHVWDEARWKPVATHTSPAGGPLARVDWSTSEPFTLARLVFGLERSLGFSVSTLGPLGSGATGGSVAVDYAEATASFAFGKVFGWGFDRGQEGWTVAKIGSAGTSVQGAWTLTLDQTDPQLLSPALDLAASTYSFFQVRVRNSTAGTDARVYWRREGEASFSEAQAADVPLWADGKWHTYRVALPASWTGAITALRFDPPNTAAGTFEVDWIRLTE